MTQSSTVWPAPAKLNLFLHVTGRRADGYHLLQTVFQFLDYGDALTFTRRDDAVIQRTNVVSGLLPDDDLVVKAARLLQSETGTGQGVNLTIEKRLPMGGGLGGGSSDAATTLVALNRLWETHLDTERLARLGLRLGADVPVFIHGYSCWAEGVGEKLTPVQIDEPWYVVVIPPCQVATAEIFSAEDLTRDVAPIKIRNFLDGAGTNVCEPVVRKRYPVVDDALRWLGQYGDARMSGTGACIFAAFSSEERARSVYNMLPREWRGILARGKNRSPLYSCLASVE